MTGRPQSMAEDAEFAEQQEREPIVEIDEWVTMPTSQEKDARARLMLAQIARRGRSPHVFIGDDGPPRVGDKVLYVPPGEPDATSPAWARRAVPGRESLVIRGPRADSFGKVEVYDLIRWKADDEPFAGGEDLYYAPAHRLRVVERATYRPA